MDCEDLLELVPAYCIQATDADETRQIENALTRCPELAAEIERFRAVDEALLRPEPQVAPPAALLGNLMREARASMPDRPAPVAVPKRRTIPRWVAATAAVVVFVVLNNLYWVNRLDAERTRELWLPTAVVGEPTGATARVIWSTSGDEAVLIADNFPALTDNTGYQVWLRRGENLYSLGVFVVDENGVGTLTFDSECLHTPFDVMGITREPRRGSEAPTSQPVVRWQADA